MPGSFGVGQVHDEGLTVGAHSETPTAVRRRAVRQTAMLSTDATDYARLLSILGLEASEGVDTKGTA